MRLNAFFPSLDIGTDPARIRDWARAVDGLPALQISTVVPSREGAHREQRALKSEMISAPSR